MKQQTKRTFILAVCAVLLVCVLSFALVACNDGLKNKLDQWQQDTSGSSPEEGKKTVEIIVGDEVFSLQTETEYVMDALIELKETGKISVLEYTTGQYGAMIQKLGNLVPDANSYITFYHTVNEEGLKGADWETGEIITIEYNGKTYYYANLGVSSFPLRDGASYRFFVKKM